MKVSRVFKIKNRLTRVVQTPGGKTIAEALRRADSRIETLRASTVASFEGQVRKLTAFAEQGRADPEGALEGLYQTANEIFSVAGVFGYDALGEAAYGLCDLVEQFSRDGQINWLAIAVHVDGIRLLSTPGCQNAEAVEAGLRDVRALLLTQAEV